MQYIIDDDLFDQTFIEMFDHYSINTAHWYYGRKSALDRDNLMWGSILYEQHGPRNFFAEYILSKFCTKHNIKAEVLSCVLNGQTKDQQSTWHVDIYSGEQDIDNKYTLVYYVNKDWNDQSGHTEIRLPNNEILKVDFVPGRLLFFPSAYQHFGAPPSVTNKLRTTCAFKLNILGKLR
jgi:2OG-Fe(II) oxygenase superfamily